MRTTRWFLGMSLMIGLLLAGCQPRMHVAGTQLVQGDLGLLRDTANEDFEDKAAAIAGLAAGATGDYANKPTTDIFPVPLGATAATVYASGTNAANDSFGWVLSGYVTINGPKEIIATGTATLGTQAVVLYPHDSTTATSAYWVDTFTVAENNWRTSVGVVTQNQGSGALNYIDTITFDPLNLAYLVFDVYTADGSTGTEAGSVTAYIGFTRE